MTSCVLVVGGSGFIGHNLCQWLSNEGVRVVNLDCRVPRRFIPGVTFIEADATNVAELEQVFANFAPETVFHLAANSDIAAGASDASLDFRDTLNSTVALRQVVDHFPVEQLVFASSSAVFGISESRLAETSEQCKTPISWYGHAKLASEYVLESLSHHQSKIRILFVRFPNVVGSMATHGVVYDFIQKLYRDPLNLQILGDGNQTKPYIHVGELIQALVFLVGRVQPGVSVFNVGPEDAISVREIADAVCRKMDLNPTLHFGDSPQGWLGDVPKYLFDAEKIRRIGFSVQLSSLEAVELAITQLVGELNPDE
jgi:UDP-glucose 4-epimerase